MPHEMIAGALDSEHLTLGDLANPQSFNDSIDLGEASQERSLEWLRLMWRVRAAEMQVADLIRSKEAVCPCHLAVGQEAVGVGVATALRPSDRVYGTHRSHAQFLALGGDLQSMFAEILGRVDGASKGMGGSMHLYAPEVGFHGSVPIVGATIPIAVGAALAAKMDGRGDVAVCFFGDGACEEGVLHEALNLASVMKLPVLFVCENNLYSSHLDIHLRQPTNSMARFARSHSITTEVVDGNDVAEVYRAAEAMISRMRAGGGPGFLEAVTFRWLGHVGANEDIDVGVERSLEQLQAWKARDPIRRLEEAIVNRAGGNGADLRDIEAHERAQGVAALDGARKSGWPEPSALLDLVYSHRSKVSK